MGHRVMDKSTLIKCWRYSHQLHYRILAEENIIHALEYGFIIKSVLDYYLASNKSIFWKHYFGNIHFSRKPESHNHTRPERTRNVD